MNQDLLNILANSNKDIDNQVLMDYLSGKLSGKEKHEVEKLMAESDFMNDAMEGLTHLEGKGVESSVRHLNRELRKSLRKKKGRRGRRILEESPWTYLAIILILLLCFVSYVIIHRMIR